MSDNPTKYEVLIEQYLHSILDISDRGPLLLNYIIQKKDKKITSTHASIA